MQIVAQLHPHFERALPLSCILLAVTGPAIHSTGRGMKGEGSSNFYATKRFTRFSNRRFARGAGKLRNPQTGMSALQVLDVPSQRGVEPLVDGVRR